MVKSFLILPFLLSGSIYAADPTPTAGDSVTNGQITKAQFMDRAEKRFTTRDTNGDRILQVAEEESAIAQMHEMIKQSGMTTSDKRAKIAPMSDTYKIQYLASQKMLFKRLDMNGDDVISAAEWSVMKNKMQQPIL